MRLCSHCTFFDYCRNRFSPLVSPEQIKDRRVRQAVHRVMTEMVETEGLTAVALANRVSNLMRDYPGRYFDPRHIVDERGVFQEALPDFDALWEMGESWWKQFLHREMVLEDVSLRGSKAAWQALASVLIAARPYDRVRILGLHANNNHPPRRIR